MANPSSPIRTLLLLPWLALAAGGCGTATDNPSFALTQSQARGELVAMQDRPMPLARPVVVIDGYLDPGIGSSVVAGRLRRLTPDPRQVLTVNLFWAGTFDDARAMIVGAVEAAFPSDDPAATREVDVVGISMGGLAARYAALPTDADAAATTACAACPGTGSAEPAADPGSAGTEPELPHATPPPAGKRLRIARLFTLATPHQGAVAAVIPTFVPTQRDMRAGSAFLARLNGPAATPDYPIIPYARLADEIVGESHTAPPGQTPIWVPNGLFELSHLGIAMDPRVAADIARRLRGEQPFATEPRAPLPE